MGFEVGASILAYQGSLIYDAKILNVDKNEETKETLYYIHYQGWKKKWDEWVGIDRILEDNAQSRDKQEQAKYAVRSKKAKIDGSAVDKRKQASEKKTVAAKQGKPNVEKLSLEANKGEDHVPIAIPFGLKKHLVEEWEAITKEPRRLVALPKKPCVSQILDLYVASKKKKSTKPISEKTVRNIQEVLDGLRVYFDRCLDIILLYSEERMQYEEIKAKFPNMPMSNLYGAEHLLRLFVKLPLLLAHEEIDSNEKTQIQTILGDFLKHLQKNYESWFSNEYQVTPSEFLASSNPSKAVCDHP